VVQATYPGVYVQEVSSGVRPIAAASTSTPAFVGLAEMGPDDEARRITNWTEFQKTYGSFIPDGYLAESVFQFFNNGGSQCYVVRVTRSDAAEASVTVYNRDDPGNRAPSDPAGIKFSAKNKGEWGNYLYLQIEDGSIDPGNTFKVSVRKQKEVDLIPADFMNIAPLEVHDNLSVDPNSPNYVETVLKRASNLIDADVLTANTSLQRGTHWGDFVPIPKNDQGNPLSPIGGKRKFQINVDGDGYQEITLPAHTGNNPETLSDIASAIAQEVKSLTKKKEATKDEAFSGFGCEVDPVIPADLESFDLSVRSLGSPDDFPANGSGSVIVGKIGAFYHVRVFNSQGTEIVNRENSKFLPDTSLVQALNSSLDKQNIGSPDKENLLQEIKSSLLQRLKLISGTNNGVQNEYSSVRVQNSPTNNAAVLLKLGAAYGRSEDAMSVRRPINAEAIQVGDAAVAGPVAAATPGSDGNIDLDELAYSEGFTKLDNVTDISLLAVPGVGTTRMMDLGLAYCENRLLRDLFYIGDPAPNDHTPDDVVAFRKALTKPNSYGAVYYPWIKSLDLSGRSQEPVLYPPSGYIAGLYGRIDANRGVWKAPAGTEATLSGAVGLSHKLSDKEHGNLNPLSINCIRQFDTAGIVSFGARTVTSDPEYLYVPVRRMAIMLRVSIYNGIQWAVFEPNDEPLWAQLRRNITSFMMGLFRRGAFQGSTPSQAFFVKCDSETTPQDAIDSGEVRVLVGFAPLKPAEFVMVQISQKAGQGS
jgi:phage tail sheath protein FI